MAHYITESRLKELLDYNPETGIFCWKIRRKGLRAIVGTLNPEGYRQIGIDHRTYLAHQLAFLWMTGEWPKQNPDHIDGNPDNNRWSNLREASCRQNSFNMKKTHLNKSGYKGVSWDTQTQKWRASIKAGRRIALGRFENLEDAASAYREAAEKYHGEFARIE